jgi:carbon monoxide dehydrogenase subunit G
MKYLKYAAIILSLLVVLFLLLGVIKPTIEYDCEITVDKPLQECWDVTQDPAKMTEWMSGFKRFEHVSGEPGQVGAVSNVIFESNGSEVVIKETIIQIIPNHSIEMSFENDMMQMEYVMRMKANGESTEIETYTLVEGNDMITKSFIALDPGAFRSQEDTNLDMLKKTIEENIKMYQPETTDPVEGN